MLKTNCVICNKEFKKPENKNNRCCSWLCRKEYFKQKNTKICLICRKEFVTWKKQKCCSFECGMIFNRKRIKKECLYCKKEFETIPSENHNYCCSACGNRDPKLRSFTWAEEQKKLLIENYPKMEAKELMNILNKTPKQIDYQIRKHFSFLKKHKPPKILACENCKREFRRYYSQISISGGRAKKLNFCSMKCKGEWMSLNLVGENSPSWNGGYFPYFGKNWHLIRRQIRDSRLLICEKCGKSESELEKKLHLHHIIPRRFFSVIEESNNPSNLILLCKNCHKLVEWEVRKYGKAGNMPEVWKAETITKLSVRNDENLPTGESTFTHTCHDNQERVLTP